MSKSDSVHIKAMQALLNVPYPAPSAEAAIAFKAAEEAYNRGQFQKCLDLLASVAPPS